MSLKKRLTTIEESLAPKKQILGWIEDLQQFKSFTDYLADLVELPLSAMPRVELPNKVAEVVRKNLERRGIQKESITRAILLAQKNSYLLVALVLLINETLSTESERNFLSIELLAEQRSRMARESKKSFDPEGWEWWRRILIVNLLRMLRLKIAIAAISRKYYDGHPIAFHEQEAELDENIRKAELLAGLYNVRRKWSPSLHAIDLAAVRRDIEQQVPALVRELVDLAKAEMYIAFGENHVARRTVQAHLVAWVDRQSSAQHPPDDYLASTPPAASQHR